MKDLKDAERKSSLRPTPRPPKSLPRGNNDLIVDYIIMGCNNSIAFEV
ncbi:MAG: hypothetical protein AAFY76_07410 [Cyanobacteria bacterium J06649_11]